MTASRVTRTALHVTGEGADTRVGRSAMFVTADVEYQLDTSGQPSEPYDSNPFREMLGYMDVRKEDGSVITRRSAWRFDGAARLYENALSGQLEMVLGGHELVTDTITSQKDDYEPTRFAYARLMFLSVSGVQYVTGFGIPDPGDVTLKLIVNPSDGVLVLAANDSDSTSGGRIETVSGAPVILEQGESAWLWRNDTTGFWRVSKCVTTPRAVGGAKLEGWYDADDPATIRTDVGADRWFDKSGNAHHLIQDTDGQQPAIGADVLGRGQLEFNGSSSRMQCTNFAIAEGTKLTAIVVGTFDTTAADKDMVNLGSGGLYGFRMLTKTGTPNRFSVYAYDNDNPDNAFFPGFQEVNTEKHVYELRYEAAGTTYALDGYDQSADASTGGIGGNGATLDRLTIGCFNGANYFTGSLQEILFFNDELTTAELAAIRKYLRDKYRHYPLAFEMAAPGKTEALYHPLYGVTTDVGIDTWSNLCPRTLGSHTLAQATGSLQPVQFLAGGVRLSFDGVDDFMQCTDFSIAEGAKVSLLSVVGFDDTALGAAQCAVSLTVGGKVGMSISGTAADQFEVAGRDNDSPDNGYNAALGALNGTARLIEGHAKSTGIVAALDGTETSASAATSGMGTDGGGAATTLTVGAYLSGNQECDSRHYLHAVCVDLTDSEIAAIRNFVAPDFYIALPAAA